ncbi:MAG: hypothetical protein IKV21_03265 [Clostridia bacterium]|nr:hypothetical protein [Clostridia bacterium]
MKKAKKILSVFLAAVLVMLVMASPVGAASKLDPSEGPVQKAQSVLYMIVDELIRFVGKILNKLIPGADWGKGWQDYEDYTTPDTFYEGEAVFETQVDENACWSAGYSYGSLLEGLDILNGEYNMAGSLEVTATQKPTGILDDQGVNVYAISDGTGGIVVQAVIDGYGIARGDVLKIREKLAAFAAEKNIISINVSVLHQHSLIDTLGMGVALLPALILNPGMNATGMNSDALTSGKTEKFMNNLYEVVARTVTEAVEDMEEGRLYYSAADASDLMHDKRKPDVLDGEIHRFRFDPFDESSEEIWICEAGIHCTGMSSDNTDLTSDFPYYFKEYVKETQGADVVYVQGAEVAITTDRTNVKYTATEKNSKIKAYGIELAKRVIAIEEETELEPVLNITLSEVSLTADNPVHVLAVREGIVDSVATKNGNDFTIFTEIGYMELGNKIGVLLVPGEIAPEIIWGGAVSKEESWNGKSWDYAPIKETAGVEKVICFGLNNDQIGYILPDNDIRSMFTENEEINVASVKAGSVITAAFEALIAKVK